MKRYFCRLSYLWILLAMPLAASTSRIYVLNINSDTIDVIDPVTNKVVQTIKGIAKPHGAVFSPDGSRAYIASETTQKILAVVDTKTGKIIKEVLLSGIPNLPAITKDGSRVVVCIHDTGAAVDLADKTPRNLLKRDQGGHLVLSGGGAVDIVDTTSLERVKTLPMKEKMHDCYTTPDGKYVVAGGNRGNFAFVVIDVQTEQIAWEIDFGRGVLPIAFESGPDGSTRRIFPQLEGLHGFAVVDFAKRKEVARIKFPETPRGFDVDPNSTHGIGTAPDGKTLWAVSSYANAVFVYSLPELKLLGHVPMPELKAAAAGHPAVSGHPHWVTFTPDSKTVYIGNSDVNVVSAIDVKTLEEGARIPVGMKPGRVHTLVLP